MTSRDLWNGVSMRVAHVTADPDDPIAHAVSLPATWEDEAAAALLQLSGGTPGRDGITRLSTEAERWIAALDALDEAVSQPAESLRGTGRRHVSPGRALACLLLMRQVAPNESLWQGLYDRRPGFVINLAAFVPDGTFAGEAFVAAIRLACDLLRRLHGAGAVGRNGELPLFDIAAATPPRAEPAVDMTPDETFVAPAGLLLLTNLDGCLAQLGLDYDSAEGRDAACALAWLASSLARQGAGPVPLPPALGTVPGLAAIGMQVRDQIEATDTGIPLAPIETGFSGPGPIDALLGVEACGLAPIFSPLGPDATLRPSTIARLAHRGFTPETAFAAALAGEAPLPSVGPQAHLAMHRALTGFVDRLPARPDPAIVPAARTRLERGMRRPLPARHGGFTQRASVGGHRLYLRTGEYEDGSLGEISIVPTRESAMVRGLLESVGQAVSIGLQYGAPLDAYVGQFAHTRFGPGGTVEGDPVAAYATSLLDYAFRALSDTYLGRRLPDGGPTEEVASDADPMLPLSLPDTSERRSGGPGLRLVG